VPIAIVSSHCGSLHSARSTAARRARFTLRW
jgi:hypothetical protein